jgi:hypothetical protein
MQNRVYDEMMKLAVQQRRANECEAQSFARYCRTPEGAAMLRKHQQAQLGLPADTNVAKSAPAASDWNALVAGIQGMGKGSLSKAIDAALATEAGREAFKIHKRNEMLASKQYTIADITLHDSVEAVRQYNYDMHKANTKPLFMQMVDDVRSRNPSMSMMDAMDHVRSIKPEGEDAWLKFKTLGLANNPMDGALSGRPARTHETLWDSPHSGSRQDAGVNVRPAAPADDTPRFKSATDTWSDIVAEFRKSSGWDWARAVNVLKHHPASCSYYAAMCRENSAAA